MRFMMLVKADRRSEAGVLPEREAPDRDGKFNEELVKAGVMLAGEGCSPARKARASSSPGTNATVIDGPFTETKELIAGYWLWQVKSMEEAIEWVKRCPNPDWRGERDRDSPGVRSRGLRRRAHARAPRAGGAPARAGGREEVTRGSDASRVERWRLSDTHRAIDAVWRIESPRLIAGLARIVRDVGLAEELAQDALVAALEQWPESGVPDNPGAWLMATAKHRAIDLLPPEQAARAQARGARPRARDPAGDGRRPISTPRSTTTSATTSCAWSSSACHPVLSTEARVALTLRLLGGLTTEEIARAFLVPEPTIAQRIVRAKRTLAEARVPFEVPRGAELAARLSSVLEVIYLVFNEGYSATAGDDWMRPALCEDALRLGRILAELAPKEPEVHGLVALMEIQASRLRARVGPSGEPSCCSIRTARAGISSSSAAVSPRSSAPRSSAARSAPTRCRPRSPPVTPARVPPAETDWARIAALYDALAQLAPSPVVELNRAVAVAMAFGPAAGLELVDALTRSRRSRATTCCRACAATCSPSSAASTRRAPSSSAPHPLHTKHPRARPASSEGPRLHCVNDRVVRSIT